MKNSFETVLLKFHFNRADSFNQHFVHSNKISGYAQDVTH